MNKANETLWTTQRTQRRKMPGQFIRRVKPPQADTRPVIIDVIHFLAQFAGVRFEQLNLPQVREQQKALAL
jgi:hypothetical protein